MARKSGDCTPSSNKTNKEVRFNVSDLDKIEMNSKFCGRRRSSLVVTRRLNADGLTHVQQETESDEFQSAESLANHLLQNWPADKF